MQIAKTEQERKKLRDQLKTKYKTLVNASKEIGVNVFTLSRAINGNDCDLDTGIRILKGAGYLPAGKYKMPRIDLETFFLLNAILNVDVNKGVTTYLRNGRKVKHVVK